MASPRFVRTAAAVSIVTTGAAAYYFLSDGGDHEKLEERLRDTRARLDATVTSARNWTTAAAASVRTQLATGHHNGSVKKNDDGRAVGANIERTGEVHGQNAETAKREQERESERERSKGRETGGYCHTCSGPRIWFFAEKLRLKRRFTPYPDPPRE